jgi:hypothetical protein
MFESNVHANRAQLPSVHFAAAFVHATPHANPLQVGTWRSSAAGHFVHVAPQLSIVSWIIQAGAPSPALDASCCWLGGPFTLPHPSAVTSPTMNVRIRAS